MTYGEIKKKFLIEYDKEGNSFSSYPSLTNTEIATILDKAYLAIIAQKLTGNNPRRAGLEADTKSVSDIQPLITTDSDLQMLPEHIDNGVDNERTFGLPDDFLYYVTATGDFVEGLKTIDLVSHENAKQFFVTTTNYPWIKNAVAFIEGNTITVVYDPYEWHELVDGVEDDDIIDTDKDPIILGLYLTYIKRPLTFEDNPDETEFDLNDSMAEELINLAVIMALENVESTRLTTKVQTRPLEA